MDSSTKRRVVLGTMIGALAAGPFVMSRFRKSAQVQLPYSGTVIWKAKADPAAVPSGWFGVVDEFCVFEPLTLPRSDIRELSIAAVPTADNKNLLISYSYGEDCKAELCYAPLDKSGLPGKVNVLKEFPPGTVLGDLGGGVESRNGLPIAMRIRHFNLTDEPDAPCTESLHRMLLKRNGTALIAGKDVKLTDLYSWVLRKHSLVAGFSSLCFIKNTDSFFYDGLYGDGISSINKFNDDSGSMDVVRSFGKYDEKTRKMPDKRVCSRIYDRGDGTFQFIEGPLVFTDIQTGKKPYKDFDIHLDIFNTYGGKMVTMDANGNVIAEEPFPSLPFEFSALLTRDHWCFENLVGRWAFYFAKREEPREFTELRFRPSHRKVDLGNGEILYRNFHLCALLPSDRHLLCVRRGSFKEVPKARQQGIPVCELGIIELPLSID